MKNAGPKKISKSYLTNAAHYYLSRFASTEAHLAKILSNKVRKRAEDHHVNNDHLQWIAEVVADCIKNGLVDDVAFANARARSLHCKGRSLWRIKMELREKGVGSEMALAAIDQLESDEPDFDAAIIFARKRRFGPFQKKREKDELLPNQQQKILAAFARAGFSYDMARRILEAQNVEELSKNMDKH